MPRPYHLAAEGRLAQLLVDAVVLVAERHGELATGLDASQVMGLYE